MAAGLQRRGAWGGVALNETTRRAPRLDPVCAVDSPADFLRTHPRHFTYVANGGEPVLFYGTGGQRRLRQRWAQRPHRPHRSQERERGW